MATASRSQPMQPSPNPYPPHPCAPRPRSRPAANRQDARAKALLPMEPLRRDFSGARERPNDSRLGQTEGGSSPLADGEVAGTAAVVPTPSGPTMRSIQRPSMCPYPLRVPTVDRPFPPRRHRWPTSSCARQPRKSRCENGVVRGERPAPRPLGNAVCSPKRRELDIGRWRMKAIVVTDEAAGTGGMTLVERPEPNAAEND